MRNLIVFLFVFASCKHIQYCGLPLVYAHVDGDSTFYFPMDSANKVGLDSFRNKWYSETLREFHEPVLNGYPFFTHHYRFTWLRTFNHPVTIRIGKNDTDEGAYLFAKSLTGQSGFDIGHLAIDSGMMITPKQFDSIQSLLSLSDFDTMQPNETSEGGKDGAEWILEVVEGENYKYVQRWSPDSGPFGMRAYTSCN